MNFKVYRSERLKNDELEKALKKAKIEIANSKELVHKYNELSKKHQENSKKFVELQGNVQKISLYRETINKQEEVISKLEKLVKKSIDESNKHKEDMFELEKLKTENLNLQNELKNYLIKNTISDGTAFNPHSNLDIDKYRNEISRLENIIKQMQMKLTSNKNDLHPNKINRLNSNNNNDKDIIELEIKYNKSLEKINILENEINFITKKYAEEITKLKIKIAEKEALIGGIK